MAVRRIWTWFLVAVSNPKICLCKPSIKVLNLSAWELDCTCWVLTIYSSRVRGDVVSVCPDVVWVAEPWPEGVARGKDSLLGALEEWLLLAWRDTMDIGQRLTSIFSSFGGWTSSRTMIFMRRLQKGRHVRATVFPIVWKMRAQISIGTPVMRSHKNWALQRLMNPMLDSG